ncbi:hypothetical protein HK405_007090, partial [Cladochytrium tenue]
GEGGGSLWGLANGLPANDNAQREEARRKWIAELNEQRREQELLRRAREDEDGGLASGAAAKSAAARRRAAEAAQARPAPQLASPHLGGSGEAAATPSGVISARELALVKGRSGITAASPLPPTPAPAATSASADQLRPPVLQTSEVWQRGARGAAAAAAAAPAAESADFFWSRRGRGGGGAPIRDASGNVVTSRRPAVDGAALGGHSSLDGTDHLLLPPTMAGAVVVEGSGSSVLRPLGEGSAPAMVPGPPGAASVAVGVEGESTAATAGHFPRMRSQFGGRPETPDARRKMDAWRAELQAQIDEKRRLKEEEEARERAWEALAGGTGGAATAVAAAAASGVGERGRRGPRGAISDQLPNGAPELAKSDGDAAAAPVVVLKPVSRIPRAKPHVAAPRSPAAREPAAQAPSRASSSAAHQRVSQPARGLVPEEYTDFALSPRPQPPQPPQQQQRSMQRHVREPSPLPAPPATRTLNTHELGGGGRSSRAMPLPAIATMPAEQPPAPARAFKTSVREGSRQLTDLHGGDVGMMEAVPLPSPPPRLSPERQLNRILDSVRGGTPVSRAGILRPLTSAAAATAPAGSSRRASPRLVNGPPPRGGGGDGGVGARSRVGVAAAAGVHSRSTSAGRGAQPPPSRMQPAMCGSHMLGACVFAIPAPPTTTTAATAMPMVRRHVGCQRHHLHAPPSPRQLLLPLPHHSPLLTLRPPRQSSLLRGSLACSCPRAFSDASGSTAAGEASAAGPTTPDAAAHTPDAASAGGVRPLAAATVAAAAAYAAASAGAPPEVLERYAARPARRVTLRQLTVFGRRLTVERILASANYVREELPVRLAHRIRAFQRLPFIVGTNPHVARVHDLYWDAFHRLRAVPHVQTLEDNRSFCTLLRALLYEHRIAVPELAAGVAEAVPLHLARDAADAFMNDMLRSRIGRRVLAEQHVAISATLDSLLLESGAPTNGTTAPDSDRPFSSPPANDAVDLDVTDGDDLSIPRRIGIVDTRCHAGSIARRCADQAALWLAAGTPPGSTQPDVVFDGDLDATFVYIPYHIEYVLGQVLRNAMRATWRAHHADPGAATAALPPIRITVGSTASEVAFRVSDRGGGVPRAARASLWSFVRPPVAAALVDGSDSTLRLALPRTSEETLNGGSPDPIPDFPAPTSPSVAVPPLPPVLFPGLGLPMARAHTNYWGGTLHVHSLDGFGADAYIKLAVSNK